MDQTTNTCAFYDPSCVLGWFRDELQAFSIWLYDSLLSAVASLLETIPAPGFMLNISSYTLPSTVAWAISPFQIDIGISIIVSAYIARFILRRIPIIG